MISILKCIDFMHGLIKLVRMKTVMYFTDSFQNLSVLVGWLVWV